MFTGVRKQIWGLAMKRFLVLLILLIFASLSYGQGETDSPFSTEGWDKPADSSAYYDLFYYQLMSNPGGWINRNTRKIDSLFNELIVFTDSTQLVIEDDTLMFASGFVNEILDSAYALEYVTENCIEVNGDTLTIDFNCMTDSLYKDGRLKDSVLASIQSEISDSNDVLSTELETGWQKDVSDSIAAYHPSDSKVVLRVPLTATQVGKDVAPDFDSANVGFLFPENDNSERCYMVLKLPEDYEAGTHLYPYVTWRQSAADSVGWKIRYGWAEEGEVYSASFSNITIEELETAGAYPGSGDFVQKSKFPFIDGTGKEYGDIIIVHLYRDDNVTAGDVLAWEVSLWYNAIKGQKSITLD